MPDHASLAKRSQPSSTSSANGHAKKVRFDTRNPSNVAADTDDEEDEDEDDAAHLELDTIGKGSGVAKSSAVNIDGFDSDSDDDNFNTRAAERARAQKYAETGMDEDDDGDENDPDLAVKKSKSVKFMDVSGIEGQDRKSTSGSLAFDLQDQSGKIQGVESDDDDDDEDGIDDEVGAGGRKKNAPKIDAFHMRAEGEQGKIDEFGNYLRQAADPNAVHDAWLNGISSKEIKTARAAEEKREQERLEKDQKQAAIPDHEVLATLISHLNKTETILEALRRLGKGAAAAARKQKMTRKKTKAAAAAKETNSSDEIEDQARREAVDQITEAADAMLTRGKEDVYDTEREWFMQRYQRLTGNKWQDQPVQWHYRWRDDRDNGQLHGPYDTQTMQRWIDGGFFGDQVEYRREKSTEWQLSLRP